MDLLVYQAAALEYVRQYAAVHRENALESISEVLKMSDISPDRFEAAFSAIKKYGRVAIHFHPDRLDSRLKSVAENLLEGGIYKSQFETMISNGSVSAFSGGGRDLWENKIFGGAYQLEGSDNSGRPKYGAFDLMLHPDGPAPRFGSCFFLLRPEVSQRCTFTYLDSHQDPAEKGTLDEFSDILAALFTETFSRRSAIGADRLSPASLTEHLAINLAAPYPDPALRQPACNLDFYIEAQVHGEVNLQRDVIKLIADPSFKGTYTEEIFLKICAEYDIELLWHCGFVLPLNEVPRDFRGPEMPSLAQRITDTNYITAAAIGTAAASLRKYPEQWSDRGSMAEVLQELKLLWHVLLKYGGPYKEFFKFR